MRMELRELDYQTSTFGQLKYKPDGTLYPGYKTERIQSIIMVNILI